MAPQLSVPAVIINNETIKIIPNTFVYDGGEGEVKVFATSAGGNSIETVHAVDAESKIGKAKFDVRTTSDIDSKIAVWKSRIGTNSVMWTQEVEGKYYTWSIDGASLVNVIEREATADGKVSLEWEGNPMSAQ